eukprot:757711-Hanusia_phi.AAC.4
MDYEVAAMERAIRVSSDLRLSPSTPSFALSRLRDLVNASFLRIAKGVSRERRNTEDKETHSKFLDDFKRAVLLEGGHVANLSPQVTVMWYPFRLKFFSCAIGVKANVEQGDDDDDEDDEWDPIDIVDNIESDGESEDEEIPERRRGNEHFAPTSRDEVLSHSRPGEVRLSFPPGAESASARSQRKPAIITDVFEVMVQGSLPPPERKLLAEAYDTLGGRRWMTSRTRILLPRLNESVRDLL